MNSIQPSEPDVRRVQSWRGVFLVVIALLLVSGGLAIHQYFRFSSASAHTDRSHKALSAIDELVTSLLDAENSARDYLLTGRASLLEPYTDARPRVTAATGALATLEADDPRQRSRVEQLTALSGERFIQLQSAIESHQAGRTADAIGRIASDAVGQRMDRIRLVAADMKAAEQASLDQRDEQARLARRTSLVFAIASFLLAGTLGLVAAAVDHSFQRRRDAFEREMAGRLRAESSVQSATQELLRSERFNRSILDTNGNIQFNELSASTSTPTFGRNVSTTNYDPALLNGWGKRGYNWEYTVAAQHQIAERVSVNGGYYRRSFGNQTFTDDLRYDANSYDSFCITAPVDPDLPGGGGYDVCGVMDLKPAVFAQNLPANNLIRFSDDFGGETNRYQGFDINIEGRFRNGSFLKGGIAATSRLFDNCNLLAAGMDAVIGPNLIAPTFQGTETYADGSKICHREYPYRPDVKLSGAYTLPFDIQLSGVYQFSRGVQTGGAGPSIQANWAVTSAVANPFIGRNWTGTASRTIQLIREGLDFGEHNLSQLDLRASKRVGLGRYRLRVDFDAYNIFNSSWPFTVSSTYTTAPTSAWLRPTNVLQSRFFKLGAQLSF